MIVPQFVICFVLTFLFQYSSAHPVENCSFLQEQKVPAELLTMPSFLISNGASVTLYKDILSSYWNYLSDLEANKPEPRFFPEVEQNEIKKMFFRMDSNIGLMTKAIDVEHLVQHRKARDRFVNGGHFEFARFESWKRLDFIQRIVDMLPYVQSQSAWSNLERHMDGVIMSHGDTYFLPVATPELIDKSDFVANSIMPVLIYGILSKPSYVDGEMYSPMLSIVHDRDHFRTMKYFWRNFIFKSATDLKNCIRRRHAELMALDNQLALQPQRRRKALAKKMVNQLFDDFHEYGSYKIRTFAALAEQVF